MPEIVAASSDSAFELTLAKVVARIDDSHGFYSSRYRTRFLTGVDPQRQQLYRLKLQIARIEDRNVVVASGEPGISRGDIITRIEGLDADTFFARWAPYFASSNTVTKFRDMYGIFCSGAYGAVKRVEILDHSNTPHTVGLAATTNSALHNSWFSTSVDTLPEWKIGNCGFGYVNMGKLAPENVRQMYQELKSAPVIVFDIRNYPQGTLWDLKPLLFGAPSISARFFAPDLSAPGYYFSQNDLYNFGSWSNDSEYRGRVIVLVNEQTQSQAEYTAQALRTHPNALIIGSQSAGADGNISFLDLPNIRTYWTSLGWFEHDWYNPQRAGVRVDIPLRPTIAGVRQGRDEVLERAFDCRLGVPAAAAQAAFTLAQGANTLVVTNTSGEVYDLELRNMLGQRVLIRKQNSGRTQLETGNLAAGVYMLVLTGRNGFARADKIRIR